MVQVFATDLVQEGFADLVQDKFWKSWDWRWSDLEKLANFRVNNVVGDAQISAILNNQSPEMAQMGIYRQLHI